MACRRDVARQPAGQFVGIKQRRQRQLVDRLGFAVAEQGFGAAAELADDAVLAQHDHRDRRGVQDRLFQGQRLPEPHLVPLAVGDVALDAGHAQGTAVGGAGGHGAAAAHPDVAAVLAAHAVVAGVVGDLAVEHRLHRGQHARQVVRMHPLLPLHRPVVDLVRRMAQHGLPARAEVAGVGGDVPIPQAIAGGFDGLAPAVVGLLLMPSAGRRLQPTPRGARGQGLVAAATARRAGPMASAGHPEGGPRKLKSGVGPRCIVAGLRGREGADIDPRFSALARSGWRAKIETNQVAPRMRDSGAIDSPSIRHQGAATIATQAPR